MVKKIFLTAAIFLLAAGCNKSAPMRQNSQQQIPDQISTPTSTPNQSAKLAEPLSNALSRVTKKPFGIYITPQNSPVSPEKFKGYHTGTDFETFADEQNVEVPVYGICDGKLLLKKYASGYGGVVIESCLIDGADMTVVYGHLKLSSVFKQIKDSIKAGEQIGILGKGFSSETDGERKHLHLGIHKGTSAVLLGYVQNKYELENWLNPEIFLK